MLALVASVIFFLAAFHVKLGDVDMLFLGLGFLTLHLAWDIALPVYRRRTAQQ